MRGRGIERRSPCQLSRILFLFAARWVKWERGEDKERIAEEGGEKGGYRIFLGQKKGRKAWCGSIQNALSLMMLLLLLLPPPLPSEVGKKRCACFALPNGANGGEKREREDGIRQCCAQICCRFRISLPLSPPKIAIKLSQLCFLRQNLQ